MIRLFSLDFQSLPYRPRFKCGFEASMLGLSGVTSLAGSAMTNDTNKEISDQQLLAQQIENQKNRDYNTEEAEKARRFVTSERQAQQEYQTSEWSRQQLMAPQLQRQGLELAGVNPGVYYGQSVAATGSSVSAPTGASSPAASFSTGLSPVPYQALNPLQGFAQVAQGVQSLASAKEKGANVDLILKQIDAMSIDMQYKQVLKQGVQLENQLKEIHLKYEDRKLVNELVQQSTDILVGMATATEKKSQAAYLDRLTKLQDSVEVLNKSLANYNDQKATLARLDVDTYFKRLNSLLSLQGAQAHEAEANAQTTDKIRDDVARITKYSANIKETEDFIKSNTAWNEVQQSLWNLKAAQLISDQLEQAIEQARKQNNWFVVRQLIDIVDTGLRGYGTVKGVKTGQGFVDAQQQRNRIEEDFNNWKKQHADDAKTLYLDKSFGGYGY